MMMHLSEASSALDQDEISVNIVGGDHIQGVFC